MKSPVMDALDGLPERCRLSIWLHHFEGFSWPEVAQVLSLPEFMTRFYVWRGLRLLRTRLATAGHAISFADLAPAIESLPAEPAPASLLETLGRLAATFEPLPVPECTDVPDLAARATGEIAAWNPLWQTCVAVLAFGALALMLLWSGEIRGKEMEFLVEWLGG